MIDWEQELWLSLALARPRLLYPPYSSVQEAAEGPFLVDAVNKRITERRSYACTYLSVEHSPPPVPSNVSLLEVRQPEAFHLHHPRQHFLDRLRVSQV